METKITPNITFKSVLSKYTDIKQRNAHFDELDDQGKRLEIAWDALQLIINNPNITPAGQYGYRSLYWSSELMDIRGDLQKELNSHIPECRVCERGLIMLSTIRLGNNIGSDDSSRSMGAPTNLQGFSRFSMECMEREYERSMYFQPYNSHTREKMANILCNVLVNGDFNTADKTDYLVVKPKQVKLVFDEKY